MWKHLGLLGAVVCAAAAGASPSSELTRQYCVELSAAVRSSPPQITLNWPQLGEAPRQYQVFRKAPGATRWGGAVLLPGTATTYVDTHVCPGTPYEYQVVKCARYHTGYGYICAGIQVPLTEDRGKLLLVVERTYAPELAHELTRLEQDLQGDGWTVIRLEVDRKDSVLSVKRRIVEQYRADPTRVQCVFLFGHVPVPYSGDIVPDGHEPAHQGAWPCDGYYGDMEGRWTDQTVNDSQATDVRNHNVPGDGKFDQSTFPAPLKLMVGRVDLANLPGRVPGTRQSTFAGERELLRNYLDKDHRFRTGQMRLPPRGLVGDYFGAHDGEAFAASGWRSFSPLLGASNLSEVSSPGTWISTLRTTPCLWAYGCGPGTYESIGGLGTFDRHHTATLVDLVHEDVKAAFVLLYGSWSGDWDAEDDLLRAPLALPSYGLACMWSGRPHWFLHPMGLGEPLGFAARLTQNNGAQGLYQTEVNTAAGQVHVALMGDPTLRLQSVTPPSGLTCTTMDDGVALDWTAAGDSVLGYYVYRAPGPGQSFVRLTRTPLVLTHYTDANPEPAARYMVRAVKLETSGSGTYFNLSQGALAEPVDSAHATPALSQAGGPGPQRPLRSGDLARHSAP